MLSWCLGIGSATAREPLPEGYTAEPYKVETYKIGTVDARKQLSRVVPPADAEPTVGELYRQRKAKAALEAERRRERWRASMAREGLVVDGQTVEQLQKIKGPPSQVIGNMWLYQTGDCSVELVQTEVDRAVVRRATPCHQEQYFIRDGRVQKLP
jgi:hypothetical protein